MNSKTLLTCALAAAAVFTANAVPAKRGLRTITQPDGTTIAIQRLGDENLHFTLSDDNKLLTLGENGIYQYVRINADGLVEATGVKAYDQAVRPASHQYQTYDISDVDIDKVKRQRAAAGRVDRILPARVPANLQSDRRRAIPQSGLGLFSTSFPSKGKIKGLIILVQYKDIKFGTSYTNGVKQYFDDLMHKDGFNEYGGTGSVHEYFYEMSKGQFDPEFDVFGPVTLSNNRSYYGGNDSYGDDKAPEQMVIDACKLIDADVNFADYDNDNDGYVDNVYVFYAGQGEASYGPAESVWPHSWEIESARKSLKLDGVNINRYACSNEWESNRPDGVGTFIHEFSHVMGLPDLYHTTSSSAAYTPGSYSCMDYGPYNNNGRTPPAYSIYERNALGWIQPRVLSAAETITLEEIQASNDGCIIQTDDTNEFFLLENRQNTKWDTYIPGHGMMIWHVDFVQSVFDNNVVNNTKSHQYVDIVEANNNPNNGSETAMAGWTWPGTTNKTQFTSSTTPALKSWSNKAIDLPITNITEENSRITFDVLGGSRLPSPEAEQSPEIGQDYFVASWKPVEGATDYLLTVYAVPEGGKAETETANMGSNGSVSVPEGWTTTCTEGYSTTSNYGTAAPSMKFSSTGKYLQTRDYDGDIAKFSYWIRPMSTNNSGTCLEVTGKKSDGTWVDVTTITPTNTTGETYTFSSMPEGIKALKFTMTKVKGNIGLDDLCVTTSGSSPVIVDGYDNVSTAGATTMRVTNLPAGYTKFTYVVKATDGESTSSQSQSITVLLTSGIEDIADSNDSTPFGVAVSGRTLTVSGANGTVEVFNTMGRLLDAPRASYGSLDIELPAAGVYIVRNGDNTAKVMAR